MTVDSRVKLVLGFAAVYLIWGSTYLAIRIGVASIPPFMLIGVRFVIGGLALYTWMRMRSRGPVSIRHWLSAAVAGALLIAGGIGLVAYAEVSVPSGLTALLIAVAPMWLVLGDWFAPEGRRPTLTEGLGLVLGVVGVFLLVNTTVLDGSVAVDRFGAFLIVVATISWATGSVFSRRAAMPQSKLLGTSMNMIAGGAILLILSFATGEWTSLRTAAVDARSLLALLYLIVMGSLAFVSYLWLLSATSPAKAGTYAYVNPVIAVILGNIAGGEILDQKTFICAAIITLAVAIIVTTRRNESTSGYREAAPPAPSEEILTTGVGSG